MAVRQTQRIFICDSRTKYTEYVLPRLDVVGAEADQHRRGTLIGPAWTEATLTEGVRWIRQRGVSGDRSSANVGGGGWLDPFRPKEVAFCFARKNRG